MRWFVCVLEGQHENSCYTYSFHLISYCCFWSVTYTSFYYMLLLGTHSYNVLGECVWSLHKETFNCFCLRCVFQLAILYSMFLKLFIVIPLSSWRYIHGPNTTFSFLRDQCIIMQFKSQYLSYLVPNSCTCHLLWSSFFQGLWSVEPHLSLQVWQHTIHVMQCDGFVHLAQTNLDPGPSWGGGQGRPKKQCGVCRRFEALWFIWR